MDKEKFRNLATQIDYELFLGVDLAGSEKRNTGISFVENNTIVTYIIRNEKELFEIMQKFQFIYIDAPLTLPHGRSSLEVRNEHHFRECDLLLRKKGIKFFPITLGPMRMLTQRGMRLRERLSKLGKEVYEVFPGAFYDVFGVKRKDRDNIQTLYKTLSGFFGLSLKVDYPSQDELDAIACLFTGFFHKLNLAECLTGVDGTIVIPGTFLKELLGIRF
jgi:predicted nuclease with RNAse H fold